MLKQAGISLSRRDRLNFRDSVSQLCTQVRSSKRNRICRCERFYSNAFTSYLFPAFEYSIRPAGSDQRTLRIRVEKKFWKRLFRDLNAYSDSQIAASSDANHRLRLSDKMQRRGSTHRTAIHSRFRGGTITVKPLAERWRHTRVALASFIRGKAS